MTVKRESVKPGRTVAIAANSCWNIVNFRAGLVRDLMARGDRVVVIAPPDKHVAELAALGVRFIPIRMTSAGLSPFEAIRTLRDYRAIFRDVRPDALLTVTIKPNIFGSWAAARLGIKTIANVSGLGTAFLEGGMIRRLSEILYRAALRKAAVVFFQNVDDRDLFAGKGLVRGSQARLLPGSGIDLDAFRPSGGTRDKPFTFLCVTRLQWTKGIREYVEAARIVRERNPEVRCQLLGGTGENDRQSVPSKDIARWVEDGIIDYLGETDDVRPRLAEADCVVLPSYREGLPRTLLEGSAMGKPLIASDVAGCRDLVIEGVTGFRCAPRSADSLAEAMERMMSLTAQQREAMGREARGNVEKGYSEQIVIRRYLDAIDGR